MRPIKEHVPSAQAKDQIPLFAKYDVVALLAPWPPAALAKGVWGNVLKVLDDGFYEVEFIEKDGTAIATGRVSGASLELIWADPG